jgi:phosphatidylserine/phosphatidylglycerophosphate/cardiolipin synthase-like enzyme
MRKTSTKNGVTVKAYAGVTGVLVAMNVETSRRTGLLGFALKRRTPEADFKWLKGMLTFPGQHHTDGQLSPTNIAPIQKFRWSDYTVKPGQTYTYVVHPVYGKAGAPEVQSGPTVTVRTASLTEGQDAVVFNRAAAASQAFSRDFPEIERMLDEARRKNQPVPPIGSWPAAAAAWLTRGLLDQIIGFISQAKNALWALDIAIYEYELPAIADAIKAARAAGAHVRVIYHAKKNDPQTAINETALSPLPASAKRGRVTSKIFHHKFIVLSSVKAGKRRPVAVLCGSANFTENGVYRQANVVHVVRRAVIAARYLTLFEHLFTTPDAPAATKQLVDTFNPVDVTQPLFAGFSPRSKQTDLNEFVRVIRAARRDVLFCTTFDLDDAIEDALLGQPHDGVLRYGLQNSRSRITGIHAERTADFATPAMLSSGLEGFLRESTAGQRGNILLHTKVLISDFTSDAPVIISGSHNYSRAASEGNDENYLILRGNRDVADCYGCEIMRLYDHYRFRHYMREATRSPRYLDPTDGWTRKYFAQGSLAATDRQRFAGVAS